MKITEPFASGNSYIHRLDPRLKIISAIVLSVTTALADHFWSLCLSLVFSIVLILMARLNWREVIKRLSVLAAFLLLIWIMLPLTFEGESIARFGIFDIYRPGILLAAKITLKSCTILMIFMSLAATMSIATMGHALHRMHFPDKLVFLLLITYRYLFVIGEEYSRLRTAMSIRCFRPATNLHSFKTIAYLIGMLFVRASLRAERVSQAMRLRGFKGRYYSLEEFKTYKSPAAFISAIIGVNLLIEILEWMPL
jgi:cobalt/nickel transport system permease protein